MVSSLSGLIPDGFIYLAASPETCMRRMTSRGRGEEGGVSLDYLGSLHSKHEEWLHTGTLRREEIELLPSPSRYMVRMMKPVPSPGSRIMARDSVQCHAAVHSTTNMAINVNSSDLR